VHNLHRCSRSTIIGAVIALVATSVGVIAAIEQLTLRARLRRTADLAQVLSGHENDPERQTALRSIHDVAVARLVSGWLLPWWRFSEFAFLAGPVLVGSIIAASGVESSLVDDDPGMLRHPCPGNPPGCPALP
jgi:hypothetical protein